LNCLGTRYAAYLVTEELIGSGGSYGDEVYTGRLLRMYTELHFLDYLSRHTGSHTEPVQHYKLICLNHLIDCGFIYPGHSIDGLCVAVAVSTSIGLSDSTFRLAR
jgi:hypothetical protein